MSYPHMTGWRTVLLLVTLLACAGLLVWVLWLAGHTISQL